MRLGQFSRYMFVLSLSIALCPPVLGNVLETIGTIDVPGPGELEYRVAAQQVPGTNDQISFWLDVTNKEDFDITIIACAMLRAGKKEIDIEHWDVCKVNNRWECTSENNETRKRPENSFHFGCKKVVVAKGTSKAVFDVTRKLAKPFKQKDVFTVYWDVLEDCPLHDCDQFDKPNVNLSPCNTDIITNSANIWGGNWWRAEKLNPRKFQRGMFEVHNWITMEFLDYYPARMVGTVENLPPGSTVALSLPGLPISEVTSTSSPTLHIDKAFTIPADGLADAWIDIESGQEMEEGAVISFQATVVADSGNPAYSPGDEMYRIAMHFINDTGAPEIDSIGVSDTEGSSFLTFSVSATDSITMAAAASIRFSVDGVPYEILPLAFDDPAIVGSQSIFVGDLGPVPGGSIVSYSALVADEMGNIVESDTFHTTFAPVDVPLGALSGRVTVAPNPIVSSTSLSYFTETPQYIDVNVYDLTGRLVKNLESKAVSAGRHIITWDGKRQDGQRVRSGVYFVRVEEPSGVHVERMVFLR